MKLWERYCLSEVAKIFFALIGIFFGLYILVDYSIHTRVFGEIHPSTQDLFTYYVCQFAKRAHILVPFTLMVAYIKVLTSMNQRGELTALRTAGLALQRLLRPFLFCSAATAIGLLANFQFAYPTAAAQIESFEQRYFHGQSSNRQKHLNVVRLRDNSHIVFQTYNADGFFDAFWLKNPEEIYHMKMLQAGPGIAAEGRFVDHLRRNAMGKLEKVASWKGRALPEIILDKEDLDAALIPPESLSISELWQRLPRSGVLPQLLLKLLLPTVCFLALLGPTPWCLRFSRRLSTFFIYAFSIVALLSFLTCVDAAVILGQSGAVALPFLLVLGLTGWRFAKVK